MGANELSMLQPDYGLVLPCSDEVIQASEVQVEAGAAHQQVNLTIAVNR
jgi:hypothetical protein